MEVSTKKTIVDHLRAVADMLEKDDVFIKGNADLSINHNCEVAELPGFDCYREQMHTGDYSVTISCEIDFVKLNVKEKYLKRRAEVSSFPEWLN